jgi:hypothetical protein
MYCTYHSAATAVFLDYLLQLTAFVALLTYDLKRTEAKRVDCFPCFFSTVHEEDLPGSNNSFCLFEDGLFACHAWT